MTVTADQTTHRSSPYQGTGGLWLKANPAEVADWIRAGVVPAVVTACPGWSVVCPSAEPETPAPYDDATLLMAARHVPARLGPAVGFFEIGRRAVITVQLPSRRRRVRWLVWERGRGLMPAPGLSQAPLPLLLRATGRGSRQELQEILDERDLAPHILLAAVAAVLELPRPRLLIDQPQLGSDSVTANPDPVEVDRFITTVADAARLHDERADV